MPTQESRCSWKRPAASPSRPFAKSRRPESTSSPSAGLPSTHAPWTFPCASSFRLSLPHRSGAVGGLQNALRLGHAVALRVVDAQALQHVDDFLVLRELGNGLLAGQMPDFID